MILKDRDDSQSDIDALEALLTHPRADAIRRRAINTQIRNIRGGADGESDAAYQIKVHFGASFNWLAIHDLRIEHEGLVAQIDHLLINRLMEFWLCESKRVANSVKINEHGEFTTFRDRVPQSMDSPIEQNIRHIKILSKALDSGSVRWPTRLGLTIKPELKSLVLISHGTISRPKAVVSGLETIIKTDQLWTKIDKTMDDQASAFKLTRLIGREMLVDIGRQVVQLHRPITFDWARRFGLGPVAVAKPEKAPERGPLTRVAGLPIARDSGRPTLTAGPSMTKPVATTRACASCGVSISAGIARYCASNPTRFNGQVYCMPCQPGMRASKA